MKSVKHLLAVDFESWIFSRRMESKKLSIKELRRLEDGYANRSLDYLFRVLKRNNQKITFFVVGKLEEVVPGTIEKILEEGHEVGWHSHSHPNIDNKAILEEELSRSEKIIRKYKIRGFQAPTITFFREGYKLLKDAGFEYSSSIYGNANTVFKFDGVYEIPVSTSKIGYIPRKKEIQFPANMSLSLMIKHGIPHGSSYFWSILGKNYYGKMLSNKNLKSNLFIHEWQIVRSNSREHAKDLSLLNNGLFFLPYRINIAPLFEHLIGNFQFQTFQKYVKSLK